MLVNNNTSGGWLARAALGDGSWNVEGGGNPGSEARAADRVRALITVGAIHYPPAGDAASACVTRGALSYLDEKWPGAYHKDEGIAYVSVGGDAVVGKQQKQKSSTLIEDEKIGSKEVNDVYKVRGEGSASSVAFTSYTAVSGNGEITGDGVVPLDWALLEGSRTIILDGVLHSINEAGTTLPTNKWYGADEVVDRWLFDALEEAGVNVKPDAFPIKTMLESFLPRS